MIKLRLYFYILLCNSICSLNLYSAQISFIKFLEFYLTLPKKDLIDGNNKIINNIIQTPVIVLNDSEKKILNQLNSPKEREQIDWENISGANINNILLETLKKNQLNIIEFLVTHKNVINIINKSQHTNQDLYKKHIDTLEKILIVACKENNIEIINSLLNIKGVNVNKKFNPSGIFSLYIACVMNQIQAVQALLKDPTININQTDSELGETPLYIACLIGYTEIVSLLVNHKDININKANSMGFSPFFIACLKDNIEIVNLLLTNPNTDINQTDEQGNSPLLIACLRSNTRIVKLLSVNEKIKINQANINSESPLTIACNKNDTNIIELLLRNKNIDINQADIDQNTPLIIICKKANLVILQLLLKNKNIDINQSNLDGETPLTIACSMNNIELVKQLLKNDKIEINKPDITGDTPLMIACRKGYKNIVQLLLENNQIALDVTNNNGEKALDIAKKLKNNGIIDLLNKKQLEQTKEQNKLIDQEKTNRINKRKEEEDEYNRLKKEFISQIKTIQNQQNPTVINLPKAKTSTPKNIIPNKQKTLYEQIVELKKVPLGVDDYTVKQTLLQKMYGNSIKIDPRFQKPINLFNKKVSINLDHIVNISIEIDVNKIIQFKGGHQYQTINDFMKSDFINIKNSTVKTLDNGCITFYIATLVSPSIIYKITFPQDWSAEDIYQAIITSRYIKQEFNKNALIVSSEINYKDKKFNILTVLYKQDDSDIWDMLTAYPESTTSDTQAESPLKKGSNKSLEQYSPAAKS